jgi:ParB/RepB/Spo0J family partition protein
VTEAASNFAEPHFGNIPIACVIPSKTNPRKYFDEAALNELAASIKNHGVAQPILVRPLPTTEDMIDCVEIVAGERRYRASKLAGMETIPAIVRELTDVQALEIQVIENLQRQDVHPIEEAEGYDQLMKLHGYTADQLADKVGKSRSYIFGRLKLRALAPPTREAFFNGQLSASTALLIARIPVENLQEQATKEIINDGDPMSYREAFEHIKLRYMLDLDRARFSIKDAKLLAAAGSCTACPKRTGNQPMIFEGVSADVCTDPNCFASKCRAHDDKTLAVAQKKGIPVYEGEEAQDFLDETELCSTEAQLHQFERRTNLSDYFTPVSQCLTEDQLPKPAAYVRIDGKVQPLFEPTAMQAALEKAGACETVEQRQAREQAKSDEAGTSPLPTVKPKTPAVDLRVEAGEREAKIRVEAYKRIRAAASAELSVAMFRVMLKTLLGQFNYSDYSLPDDLLRDLYDYDFDSSSEDKIFEYIDQAPMPVLQRLMMDALFANAIDVGTCDMNSDGSLDDEDGDYLAFTALTESAGVDLNAIREELAPAPAAEEEAPPEDASTTKKPTRKKKTAAEAQEPKDAAPITDPAAAWPFPKGAQ